MDNTTLKGQNVSRDAVLEAMRVFDATFADPNGYDHWLESGIYKYAIRYAGRVYPPKYILSQVTGMPTNELRQSLRIRQVFRALGFVVAEK
jgi:hypothetical protein